MRGSFKCLLAFTGIFFSSPVFAGAWVQPQGSGLFILNSLYYRNGDYFNESGKRVSIDRYRKYELNPYVEYGLTQKLTLGANLFFDQATQSGRVNNAIGDSEFFARYKLYEKNGWNFAVEPLVKLPRPGKAKLPVVGSGDPDAGLTLAAGHGWSDYFADVGMGYRHRFGAPQDQLQLSATLGWHVTPRWTLMPQAFITRRVKKPDTASFTQSSGDDYNLTKLQFSVVYHLSERASIQAGAFSHVAGKNAGDGDGILLSFWRKF